MVRKLSKKLLASVLSICTLMSVFVLGIPTAYAQEYSNTPSAISYVSELKAVNSDSASSAKSFLNGYTIIDHNFDATGKRGIYIGYKKANKKRWHFRQNNSKFRLRNLHYYYCGLLF